MIELRARLSSHLAILPGCGQRQAHCGRFQIRRRYACVWLPVYLLLGWVMSGSGALAEGLASPKGEVLLTISGNIEFTNSANGAEFDLDMLLKLEQTSITTDSPWTEKATVFTGVRVNTLLQVVGAGSSIFRASAMDDYWFDIGDIDFDKYPVVVSYKRDDKIMSARDLGPLWIMFPFDDFPELLTETNKASSVWQLNSVVVK